MKKAYTIPQVILIALAVELALIVLQVGYLLIYSTMAGAEFSFTAAYMTNTGFYIFQILGFFVLVIITVMILHRSSGHMFRNMLLLFAVGAIIEVFFYIVLSATYEGAFLYSVMDKIIAIAFGFIILRVRGTDEDQMMEHETEGIENPGLKV